MADDPKIEEKTLTLLLIKTAEHFMELKAEDPVSGWIIATKLAYKDLLGTISLEEEVCIIHSLLDFERKIRTLM